MVVVVVVVVWLVARGAGCCGYDGGNILQLLPSILEDIVFCLDDAAVLSGASTNPLRHLAVFDVPRQILVRRQEAMR